MIREIILSNMDDVMLVAKDHQYQAQIDRYRSSYVYRGVPDASYNLTTSLKRNCGDAAPELERAILRNFTKYASIDDPTLGSSVWKQMIIGQHHGLPTRLLDLSCRHAAFSHPCIQIIPDKAATRNPLPFPAPSGR